jgi:hypothetical protein
VAAEVWLPRPKPRNTKPFDSFFNASLRFDPQHGVLIFSTDWLAQPLSDANPLIRRLVEDRIRKLEANIVESLEVQLRRLLRMMVLTRRCSLELAGQFLNLEPRTLARRLEQEDIKFRELVDEARYDVARHPLGRHTASDDACRRNARLLRSKRLLARFPSLVGQGPGGLARRSRSWRSRFEILAQLEPQTHAPA